MLKIKLSKEDCDKLINLSNERNVWIEGNVLKLLEDTVRLEWQEYIKNTSDK